MLSSLRWVCIHACLSLLHGLGHLLGVIQDVVSPWPWSLVWATSEGKFHPVLRCDILYTDCLSRICSSFIYIHPPRFILGHSMNIGWLVIAYVPFHPNRLSWSPNNFSSISFTLLSMYTFSHSNKLKEERCIREKIDPSQEVEFQEMGNDSPLFRYII